MDDRDTIIIGAGPAGLAVAAALTRKRVPHVVLERALRLAASWRRHYDRLHLHTPKRHSRMPFRDYPDAYPRYPSRDQLIAFLEDYAREFGIEPECNVDVESCRRRDGGWDVTTNRGTRRARHLVVASGFSRVPRRPVWPGLEDFRGRVLHSSEYATGAAFRSRRVLVVGFGNSGAEIALDLAEHGAAPTLSIRGRVNVVPRSVLGIPITYFAIAGGALPPRVADRLNALTVRLAVGDIERIGLRRSEQGPTEDIVERRRVPVVDVGTIAAIRDGRIAVRRGIASIAAEGVRFEDGAVEAFDAIVLATGYETGLDRMFADQPDLLDADARPRVTGDEALPGLWFCGFEIVPAGLIREISFEAVRIADRIAAAR